MFLLSAVTPNILLPRYWHNMPEIVKHLLLVSSARMYVHITEYAYLWLEIFGHIRSILKETIQLDKLLSTLSKMISDGIDVEILQPDVFLDTTVFRTLHESAAPEPVG